MSFPHTTNILSVKTSLHYFHDEDNTKYFAAYTGKSGNSSGKIYNKNVKSYSLLFNGEQIDFRTLEIIEIWCKDLSERDWRKLNPEVVDSMCCLLNPAPGLYKIHFFNKKGNTSAQAFTYSTMIFRIIMYCENKNGVWHGTLPVRINTRSSALKNVWRKELKGKGSSSGSGRPRKRARLSSDSDSDSDADLADEPLSLSRPSVFGQVSNSMLLGNQHNPIANNAMNGLGAMNGMNIPNTGPMGMNTIGLGNVNIAGINMGGGMGNMNGMVGMSMNNMAGMSNVNSVQSMGDMTPMRMGGMSMGGFNSNQHLPHSAVEASQRSPHGNLGSNPSMMSGYNSRGSMPMISTDDMIIGGVDDNSSGDDDGQHARKQR